MLAAIKDAKAVNGNSQKVMAACCGVSESTFQKWSTGALRCPAHMRRAVDRAMCQPRTETHLSLPAAVNGPAYDEQSAAKQAEKRPAQPRKPEPAPRDALRPETPASGPEIAPQPKKSFWADLIYDDTAEADYAA